LGHVACKEDFSVLSVGIRTQGNVPRNALVKQREGTSPVRLFSPALQWWCPSRRNAPYGTLDVHLVVHPAAISLLGRVRFYDLTV
jgi:hypothetical protein